MQKTGILKSGGNQFKLWISHLFAVWPTSLSISFPLGIKWKSAAAAAKSRQSCPTLCHPIDGSPRGSPVHGIFQARVLEWGAIAFSEWKSTYLKKKKIILEKLKMFWLSIISKIEN